MAFLEAVLPSLRLGKTIRRAEVTEESGFVSLRLVNKVLRIVQSDGSTTPVDMVTQDLLADDWRVM